MALTEEELERYARHITLREVGGAGQQRLKKARVLAVGAGGLGSPLILYLAAAGVGTIGIADPDTVSLSNLQRQIAHRTTDVGIAKTQSAQQTAAAISPNVTVEPHPVRVTRDNVMALVAEYDLVADGSDNFETRFLLNDACFFAAKPLVSAAVTEFDGQLATYKAFDRSHDWPCYRCIFPDMPPAGEAPSCSESGILGAAAGVMGTLQAMEAIKEILGIGESLAGKLLIYEALSARFRTVTVRRDPHCRLCGRSPSIHSI